MQLGPGGGWNACRAILGWSRATITSTKLKHSAPRKDPDSRCRTKKLPTRKGMDGGSSKSTRRGHGKGELRAPYAPTHHLSNPSRSTRQQKTPDRFSLVADPALHPKKIPGLWRRKTTTSIPNGPLDANTGMRKKPSLTWDRKLTADRMEPVCSSAHAPLSALASSELSSKSGPAISYSVTDKPLLPTQKTKKTTFRLARPPLIA